MHKVILSYSILACIVCNAQNITNGTELADNLTSRSRVVVDAFENASNRVHALIQEVSPTPDLSGYATKEEIANKADRVSITSETNVMLIASGMSGAYPAAYSAAYTENDPSGRAWYFSSYVDESTGRFDWAFAVFDPIMDTIYQGASFGNAVDAPASTAELNTTELIEHTGYDSWRDAFAARAEYIGGRYFEYGVDFRFVEEVTNCVVYSWMLKDATNAINADIENRLSTTGGVVTGNIILPQTGGSGGKTTINGNGITAGIEDFTIDSNAATLSLRGSSSTINFSDIRLLSGWDSVRDGNGYSIARLFGSTNDFVRTNTTSLTVGTRLPQSQIGTFSLAVGTNNIASASGSVAFGNANVANGTYAFAHGRQSTASGVYSEAHGYNARATNHYSVVYNLNEDGALYSSHGIGTMNIRATDGAYGVYIGEQNLHQVIESMIALDEPVVHTNYDENAVIEVVTNQPLDLVRASEIADYIPQVDTSSFATKSELSPISGAVNTLWTYVYGESVWIAVTNYMRTIGGVAPSFQLWEVRGGNTNLVYWSKEEITNVTADLMYDCKTQMEASVAAVTNKFAWSAYQSASGERNPQPTAVTIVSTPSIMLTGGGEWYKCIDTGSSAVWVLKSNGLNTFGGDTNGYFRIVDDEGNAQFEVVKTASYEVGALATSTDFSPDNEFQVTYNAQGNEHPFILATTDLGTPFIQEENGAINSLGITTTWDKVDGNWRVTISQDERSSSLFVHAKMIVQGENVIKNNAPIDVSGGILCKDGVHKVRPVYTNGTITWEVVP